MTRQKQQQQKQVQTQASEKQIDIKQFVSQMNKIDTENRAQAHVEADAILLNALAELGHSELIEAWQNISKKTGGFEYV